MTKLVYPGFPFCPRESTLLARGHWDRRLLEAWARNAVRPERAGRGPVPQLVFGPVAMPEPRSMMNPCKA
jgi:hypothetical protein